MNAIVQVSAYYTTINLSIIIAVIERKMSTFRLVLIFMLILQLHDAKSVARVTSSVVDLADYSPSPA